MKPMQEILNKLSIILKVNTVEAYLHVEPTKDGFKLWVVERGSGGCTFPDMELLVEKSLSDNRFLQDYLLNEDFIKELAILKEIIAKNNPHFYDTVFFEA